MGVYWKQINHFSRLSHTLPCLDIHCNSARKTLFPDAKPFEARSKPAIVSKIPCLGAPTKAHFSAVHSVNRTIDHPVHRSGIDTGLTSIDGSHRVSHFVAESVLGLGLQEFGHSQRGSLQEFRHSQRRYSVYH